MAEFAHSHLGVCRKFATCSVRRCATAPCLRYCAGRQTSDAMPSMPTRRLLRMLSSVEKKEEDLL